MKQAAVEAQNLVYRAAEPFLPNDTPGEQVYRAYRRLRAKQLKAGWSKVRRAYYGQASEPTYLALKEQAQKVGLVTEGGVYDDVLSRLRWELRNAHGATREVLEMAIREIEGRDQGISERAQGG